VTHGWSGVASSGERSGRGTDVSMAARAGPRDLLASPDLARLAERTKMDALTSPLPWEESRWGRTCVQAGRAAEGWKCVSDT
jgi:hypothetical protein